MTELRGKEERMEREMHLWRAEMMQREKENRRIGRRIWSLGRWIIGFRRLCFGGERSDCPHAW